MRLLLTHEGPERHASCLARHILLMRANYLGPARVNKRPNQFAILYVLLIVSGLIGVIGNFKAQILSKITARECSPRTL